MLARIGNVYAYIFGWPFLARLHLGLLYFTARALGLLNYTSNSISGESRAIRLGVAGNHMPVVFDVGANEGQWIKDVLSVCPTAHIHAFEPQKNLAALIAGAYPCVTVNNLALSDAAGSLELKDYSEHAGSQHASLLNGVIDGIHGGTPRSELVSVSTLDDYCSQNGISHIDLLKIDVEGYELKVIHGAARMLKENRIGVVQFEFNEMNVIAKAFMRNFFECLGGTHRLYRLLPHGLMPLNQNHIWLNEQFVYQNIVAIRKGR